jgi:hypothetical protein
LLKRITATEWDGLLFESASRPCGGQTSLQHFGAAGLKVLGASRPSSILASSGSIDSRTPESDGREATPPDTPSCCLTWQNNTLFTSSFRNSFHKSFPIANNPCWPNQRAPTDPRGTCPRSQMNAARTETKVKYFRHRPGVHGEHGC